MSVEYLSLNLSRNIDTWNKIFTHYTQICKKLVFSFVYKGPILVTEPPPHYLFKFRTVPLMSSQFVLDNNLIKFKM